ncbi:hypothetical protein [Actinomadura rudentiformis]|uniref:hypothetical protein n=1 Tax=Actinomadura rudentiformis TaxID=359158 RepID=UPI00178C746D|nr:hypothetical protein [Actinomadura rudentiformis]
MGYAYPLRARLCSLRSGRGAHQLAGPASRMNAGSSTPRIKAMVPLVTSAEGDERAAAIAELKKVLRGDLAPVAG